ncbi:MAG: hypothetical protein WCA29_12080, partial [Jiangellales bacterium]
MRQPLASAAGWLVDVAAKRHAPGLPAEPDPDLAGAVTGATSATSARPRIHALATRRPGTQLRSPIDEPAGRVDPLSRPVLLYVDLFAWLMRASSLLGPLGTGLRSRLATQSMRNMLGPTFMSDPARTDE